MTRAIRVGLIGFGTIGTGVIRLLQANRAQLSERLGAPIELARVVDLDVTRDRGVKLPAGVLTADVQSILGDPTIDVVIELMGGYEPAKRFVLAAIAAGKSVVTANKALLAVHGEEIVAAAERARVDIGFEASVGGGIPIIRTLRDALLADRNLAIYGIVNGTANYILSTMANEGREFDEVLKAAQAQGLAEANPTFDIDGIDSAHKLALLVQLAFGLKVPFAELPVEGIRHVSQLDIAFAREFGYAIKLLAVAKLQRNRLEAGVYPAMVPRDHLLADVNGAYNAIAVEGEALGSSLYFGLGAGMMPTATAVVADVVEVGRRILTGSRGTTAPLGYPLRRQRRALLKTPAQRSSEYYMRFSVVDRPNVLAKIAGILGANRISIASVIQKGRDEGAVVPIVIRSHRAREHDLRAALKAIDRLSAVRAPSAVIRIEDAPGA